MGGNCGAIGLRVLTGLALVVLVGCLTWIPVLSVGFTVFVALLAALGTREYYNFAEAKGVAVEGTFGMLASAAVVITAHWGRYEHVFAVLLLSAGILAALHVLRGRHTLTGLASSVFGVAYVGFCGAHLVFLQAPAEIGPFFLTFLVIAVALSDSGAYFVGSAFGQHKLAPAVSPNKTWEGAVGGVIASILGCLCFWKVVHDMGLPGVAWHFAVAGVMLSLTSQLGDLVESMLKRDAGVKDSGTIFPGHGGVLDRCDGFLFAAPTLYYLLIFSSILN